MSKGFHITRLLDFDFLTEKLGTLRCRWADKEATAEIERLARIHHVDGEALARKLIRVIAHIPKEPGVPPTDENDNDDRPKLTPEQLAEISPAELNGFCSQYVRLRLRIGPGERIDDTIADKEATGCDQLAGAIIAHADARNAEMKKIVEQFSGESAAWKKRIQDIVAPLTSSKSIAAELAKYSIGETAAQTAVGQLPLNAAAIAANLGGYAGMAAQAALGRMEASERLGASIAAVRESENVIVQPFSPITIPANPLPGIGRQTNSLLEQQLAHDVKTALVLADSAAMLQSMAAESTTHTNWLKDESSKASKLAVFAMMVSIAGIIISIVVGIASIRYAKEANQIASLSPTAIELKEQIAALATAAKLDRNVLAKQATDDRAFFARVFSKMNNKQPDHATKKIAR